MPSDAWYDRYQLDAFYTAAPDLRPLARIIVAVLAVIYRVQAFGNRHPAIVGITFGLIVAVLLLTMIHSGGV